MISKLLTTLFVLILIAFSCKKESATSKHKQTYSPPDFEVEIERKFLGIPVSVESSLEDIPENDLYLTHMYSYLDLPLPIVYSTNINSDKDCFIIKIKVTQYGSLVHEKTLLNKNLIRYKDKNGIAKTKIKLFFSITKSKNKKSYKYTLFERTRTSYRMLRDSFEVRPEVMKAVEWGFDNKSFLYPLTDSLIIFHNSYGALNNELGRVEEEFKVAIYAKLI